MSSPQTESNCSLNDEATSETLATLHDALNTLSQHILLVLPQNHKRFISPETYGILMRSELMVSALQGSPFPIQLNEKHIDEVRALINKLQEDNQNYRKPTKENRLRVLTQNFLSLFRQ